ncbi:MAG TPA: hypothetical protein PK280_10855 [Planctomycetota bacterium]|nr:hypothetical protein [Planctomycetota bacterium]
MSTALRIACAALAAGLFASAGCAPAGPGPGPDSSAGPSGTGAGRSGAVLLRYRLAKDQRLHHELRLNLNSDGDSWTDEKLRAVIHQQCLGRLANPGGTGGLFMLNFLREESERTKRTKDVDGKEQPVIRMVGNIEPVISTAYGYDGERNLNYFPCDERGNFALTQDARFHRVTYDSLVYLLPVLPAGEVVAGATWTAELPVYAGTDYVYGQVDYRGGSEFTLRFSGKVEKIQSKGGSVLAQLSWKVSGAFDSQGHAERFPQAFHARQRLIHEVDAEGRGTFDVTRGVMLAKDGRATITFTSMLRIARDRGEPKWEKSVTRHRLSYECKFLSEDVAPAPGPAAAPARTAPEPAAQP